MNQRFLNPFQFDEQLCVDKSMIPYFAKHFAKQYMKGKPSNFGYKVWCLNTNNGYLIQCEPYSGKGDYNPKPGLGVSVVTKLIQKLPMSHLINFLCHWTFWRWKLRANCTDKCLVKDNKAIQKERRETYDFRYKLLQTPINSSLSNGMTIAL